MRLEPKRQYLCFLLFPLVLLGTSCRGQPASYVPVEQGTASTSTAAYVALYGARPGTARESRGSIRGDFQWALDAATFSDAAPRWQEFLTRHSPPGAEFEDGMHAGYAQAGRYELMRVYYLLGRRAEGDELMKELDPVSWFK
jgi:hypothetical protein